MKFAMITDIHFGVRNDSPFYHENLFKFLENIFFPYLEQNDIKVLLILGDTWDRRKYINLNTFHDVKVRFFKRLYDLGIQVKMIYGNHDVYHRNTNDVNSVDILMEIFPNIEVVKSYKIFDFDGLKIGMISWIHKGNLEESLEWIKTAECDILCGHFEIKNFEYTQGHLCEEGFDPNIFERFEYVFSGHFHVISSDGRITYIGNPNQTNWSDYGLKKGFHIFNTETRELEFIENPYNVYEKIQFDPDIDILKFDFSQYKDKIVRILIRNNTRLSRNKIDLFMDKLSQYAYSVDVHEIEENDLLDKDGIEISDSEYTDTMSLIDQYISSIDIHVERKKLRKIFNEIYNEAISRMVRE